MASIVGVHGVGNFFSGRSPTEAKLALASIWREDLESGPIGTLSRDVAFSVAYYAHHLQTPGRQAGQPTLDDLPPDAVALMREWLDTWAIDPGIRQGLATMPLRQALGFVAEHLGFVRPVVETFVAVLFAEVERYLAADTPHRSLAMVEVATTIAAAPEPRIVVAHSLGSVVAYEALIGYPQIEVAALVTVGSPLGLLSKKLLPADGRKPPGVKRWVNLADRGDLIAVPPNGIPRHFQGVEQLADINIHWADFHLARHYLQADAVASLIRGYL